METIIILIGIVGFGNIFVMVAEALWAILHITYLKNKFYKDIPKPFSCMDCMSFWIGLVYGISSGNVFYAPTAYITSLLINKVLWN